MSKRRQHTRPQPTSSQVPPDPLTRQGSARARWRLRAPLAAALVVVGLTATACGSSSTTRTTTTKPAAVTPAAATTTAAASTTAAPSGGLSGKWSGQYSGAYSGTFDLTWTQSGSALTGTIKLSNPGEALAINGSVNGTSIRFGTVGGGGITYTGTVSGNSMSGSYSTPAGGGSWNASKS